jgi:hypothetical protein
MKYSRKKPFFQKITQMKIRLKRILFHFICLLTLHLEVVHSGVLKLRLIT